MEKGEGRGKGRHGCEGEDHHSHDETRRLELIGATTVAAVRGIAPVMLWWHAARSAKHGSCEGPSRAPGTSGRLAGGGGG